MPESRSVSAVPFSVLRAWAAAVSARPARTLVGSGKFLLEHGLKDCLNIAWVRVARAVVHAVLVDHVGRRVARLEDVECAAHIALGQQEDGLAGGWLDAAVLLGNHIVDAAGHLLRIEW
jgi:hypothetical protein